VLNDDGTLNRALLGSIVFADEARRMQLNNLLHPLIIAAQDNRILELQQHDPGGIVIIDAALMIESGGFRRLDKLIVVHCRAEIQLQRLMSRDGLSREAAEQRINSQMTARALKSQRCSSNFKKSQLNVAAAGQVCLKSFLSFRP